MSKHRFSFLILVLSLITKVIFANDIIAKYELQIADRQQEIDLYDGVKDEKVNLKTDIQTQYASETYFLSVNRIVNKVANDYLASDASKIDQLRRILAILDDVTPNNVHFYSNFRPIFTLIERVQEVEDVHRLESILKTNVFSSLNLIAFYIDKPVAEPFFMAAAKTEPEELLRHYNEIDYKPFSTKVLDEVARVAPMKIKTYLHTWNTVHQRIKTSMNPITNEVYSIYKNKGAATRSFVLLNDIYNGTLTIEEAHTIAKYDSTLFAYLIKMRSEFTLNGEHSVDEALMYQCLKHVREINDLHEETDAIRFKSLNKFSAPEIYTLMVYSEDEIYTSTFLGMYKRMMSKMEVKSTYEFLHNTNFNKFRTFIKMCAGYNTLSEFLTKMTDYEKQKLFTKLVEGIEKANDNLESAVSIADTYGSIKTTASKQLFETAIINYYNQIKSTDPEAEKLYGLILSVLEIGGGAISNSAITLETSNLKTLPINRIYKDGKNVQQHFFFDDEDGRASYASFIATFAANSNWQILERETFVLIKSKTGKLVEIYANKPDTEYAGQDAIKDIFKTTKRWPDVVVHRGHSYFASAAIESLTPYAEIVFLGSCGGYNNISQVLKYSPNAQIISSKQIGTMLVNNKLCLQLNEIIRKGENIVWDDLWLELNNDFTKGSVANERFRDYIPPHKNLGALLIKTYRDML